MRINIQFIYIWYVIKNPFVYTKFTIYAIICQYLFENYFNFRKNFLLTIFFINLKNILN